LRRRFCSRGRLCLCLGYFGSKVRRSFLNVGDQFGQDLQVLAVFHRVAKDRIGKL
jgi:hypothetical protein